MTRPHRLLLILATLALPLTASAGTGFRMTLVPVPPRCGEFSNKCLNGAGACTVNAQCNVGALSSGSTFQLDGKKLVVKASLSGVTDAGGLPVDTDGVSGTADDYILEIDLSDMDYADVLCPIGGCSNAFLAVKVDLKKGKGKVNVDFSSLLDASFDGRALRVLGGSLRVPPKHPANCPGDNSPAGLALRAGDGLSECFTGGVVGMGGIEIRQ